MRTNLNSETLVTEIPYRHGKYQAHWDKERKAIIVLDCWYLEDGNGDVIQECYEQGIIESVNDLRSSVFQSVIPNFV